MPAGEGPSRVTLSTGHTIDLPLDLAFAVGGVTVPARRARLESILPDGLSALALAPGVGCVAFVGIRYHRVGGHRDGADSADGADDVTGLEPYDEFAVIVPAVRGSRTDLPLAQAIDGEVGGYVHWLPVTTDASVALGREIWGYPKERAAIAIADDSAGFRTVVDADGLEDPLRLELSGPRTPATGRAFDRTLWSYTTKSGELLRTQARVRGRFSFVRPSRASLEIGADLRDDLGCWTRPLAGVYGAGARAWLHEGTRVSVRQSR